MRWVWPAVSGVVLGAITGVLWLELMVLFVPFVMLGFPLVQKARRREKFDKWFDVALPAATAVLTVVLFSELPFKYVDTERVELKSACVTVGELAVLLKVRSTAEDSTQVCFAERAPTLRTVQRELQRQTGAKFEIGYCGNGSSFLFGGSPIYRAIVAKK